MVNFRLLITDRRSQLRYLNIASCTMHARIRPVQAYYGKIILSIIRNVGLQKHEA